MERASSGSTGSPPNSSESIYGLKFGKKIYFEDVGIGVQPKSSGGSSSVSGSGNPSSSPVPVKKVKNGGGVSMGNVSNSNPPRCQVDGCKMDLSGVKAYYSRHKVCAMHSKSPKVVVSGNEQRFCQQCSRFHQLTEFDQEKRSCRRRLAGHNERRRKPPPGSLGTSRYSRLSSSVFETTGRGGGGGFLMDFSSPQRLPPERNLWPTTRSPERVVGNQAAGNGNFPSHQWQNSNESPPNPFLQGSSNGNGFPAPPSFPSGDFFAGISDSGCALSLLSNQQWGSSSRPRSSDLEVSDFIHAEDATFGHPQAPQVASGTHFSTTSWAYKGNEVVDNSHEIGSELGLVQMSQPHNGQFSCEFESSSQRNGRQQYMEHEHSSRAAYSSTSHQVHWSL